MEKEGRVMLVKDQLRDITVLCLISQLNGLHDSE